MSTADATSLLAQSRLFRSVEAEGLSRLAERATVRKYRKGEPIFRQGDSGDTLCLIVEGLVRVFVTSSDGNEMGLVTLGASETFGELAALDGGVRSASAEAVEPTTVLLLSRQALLDVLRDRPALMAGFLQSIGALVRRVTDQAADLVFLDLHGRVAKLLVGLVEERGEPLGEGRVLDLQLTQSDLASLVGGSRQSVNHILRTFETLGYLEVEGRRMVVKRPDLLRRKAGL